MGEQAVWTKQAEHTSLCHNSMFRRHELYKTLLYSAIFLFCDRNLASSCPPDVIHIVGVSMPSPFFAALLLPCIMQTKEQKRERPGNEAITREFSAPVVERGCAQYTAHHHSLFFSIWWLLSDTMVHFANTVQSVHAKMAFNKQSRGLCVYSKACTCLYTMYSMLCFFIAEDQK